MDGHEHTPETRILNDLIALGEDVVALCERLCRAHDDHRLASAARRLATEHERAIDAFTRDVVRLGGVARASGTLTGAARKALTEVKAVVTPAPEVYAEEARELHERWRVRLEEGLDEPLSEDVRHLLELHRVTTEAALGDLA